MVPNDYNEIKVLLSNPPSFTVSDSKRREFIARLYNLAEEKRPVQVFGPLVSRVPVLASVSTVLMVIAIGLYIFMPSYPTVSNMKGTVKIYRARTNQWVFAQKPRERLYKADIVKTFGDGQADISVPEYYHIRVKRDSEIRLAKIPPKVLKGDISFDLNKGKVFAYYRKDKDPKAHFKIATDNAVTSVLGTDFMVESMPALNKTWVGVLDGVVQVTGKDMSLGKEASVFVEPGEKTVVRTGSLPDTPTRLMENELLELEELYRIGTKPQVALLISTGKTRVRELLSFTPLYISSDNKGILPKKIVEIAENFREAIKENSKEKHLENIRQFEEIVDEYPNPKYDVQFLLFTAAYYEYVDEHENAIRAFQRVINEYPDSNLRSIAQCAIGVIYEEKFNEPELAKAAYRKVISEFPSSPEVEEAIAGINRLTQ